MVDLLKEELISSLKNELVILNFENDCKKICKKVLTDNNVCVIINIQTNQGGRVMSEIDKTIVVCKYCGRHEYYGEMRWFSGKCSCRACYRSDFENRTGRHYEWNDLDGSVPTRQEYERQGEVET